MNDQTRIPVPPMDEPAKQASGSLIERAVQAFDLNSFAPPPVPDKLAPSSARLAARRPARELPGLPEATLAAPERPKPTPPGAEQPETPAFAEAPPAQARVPAASVETEAKAGASVEPVSFRGKHYRVNREHLRDQGLIVPEGSVTALLEEFRIVKRRMLLASADLRRSGAGAAAQRILVCSPHPGEGKTYCATNLALSIAAEKESEVLLVDADFAKPSILSVLGLPGGPGLMDALTDESADVADFVIGTDIPGLWVLPAGNGSTTDSEYLNVSRAASVLDRLTQGAPQRMVIFDSPPVLAASPAAELAKFVGQAVMVVRADKTGRGSIDDAVSLLSGCRNIELLLNAVHFSPSGRSFGSYYGYGG